MSTQQISNFTDLAEGLAAGEIAASVAKQTASRASVEIRFVGADEPNSRAVETEAPDGPAHPYTSFEQGGVRRFDHSPFARGPFDAGSDLPRFRVS
jgi:hypothetical protein